MQRDGNMNKMVKDLQDRSYIYQTGVYDKNNQEDPDEALFEGTITQVIQKQMKNTSSYSGIPSIHDEKFTLR